MAISSDQKVDYLWKKLGYSATKSDNVKQGFEEAIPSPLQIRGDKVMTDSGSIPGTIPGANTSILTVYTTSLPYECAVDGTTATPNRTWKTGITDWVSPEFGSTYQVKVWVNLASSAGNASTAGTSLSAGGSGNNDEWFFDYQAGLLHFIGTNLPNGVSFTGKSVYVSGARYTGTFGVSAPGGSGGSVGNLTISNVTISANSSAVSSSANIIFSTSGTGAVQFTGNNAIGLPVGNIANRPTRVNAGYLRFNTEYETIEVWDGTEWVQTSGGVITSEVLTGDGSTAQFALSANTTTTGVLVSINGTIQKPSTAYTVSNNVITFTETPSTGDSIEVRKLAGGTISVNYGNADVATFLSTYSGLYSNVQTLTYLTSGVAGNILPSANVTYSLGSPTRQWKDLFVSNTTIYLGGIPLSIDASGNLLVNGSLVQGSGGSGSGTSYSNVNVAAYLSTNNYLTSTTANLSNYAYAANITTANISMKGYVDNSVSTANIGIIGYIDRANTIQSNQISAANLGIIGYVDNKVSTANIGVVGYIDLANTIQSNQISAANLGIKGYIDNSTSTANIGMKGYVDSVATLSSYSNVNVAAYVTTNGLTNYSNVNLIAYLGGAVNIGGSLTTLNAGNISAGGYFLGNGSQLSGLPAGYSNVQVATYLPTYSGNIANVRLGVSGVLTFSDGTTQLTAAVNNNFSNVNVTAYVTSMGVTNYSNVNVIAYLAGNISTGNITATGFIGNGAGLTNVTFSQAGNIVGTQSNVTLQAGTFTSVFTNQGNVTMPNVYVSGNVTVGGYFIGNGALLTGIAASSTYSNVQVATYLPTYAGNIANIRLGVAGVLTFADSTTQITAAVNNNFGNVNVSALITTNGLTNYSNVNVASYLSTATINTTGNITAGNLITSGALYVANITTTGSSGNISGANYITANYFVGNGSQLTGLPSGYSNVQVATYLPTYSGNIANIRLGVAGVMTFADSTTQTTAAVNNNFGNVNVAALITTNGLTNYSNVNTKAYAESMGYQNYGNVNVTAYVTSMGVTNYSNVNVASYLSTATINTTGNITAQNVTGNISITGNIIGTLPNVTITAGTYVSTFNNQGNVILPNVYVSGGATVAGTVNSNGGTAGTAFAVRGSGAVSNVALGYFPPVGTPAEMAIRDYSTANSTMYFDNTIGSANVGGTFQFRSTSSFTQWARIDRFGINLPTRPAFRVNGTGGPAQTTANVNLKSPQTSVVFNQGSYYNDTTGQFVAPVAGLYAVGLNARVNINASSQIAVLKNGLNSSGSIVCFWETVGNAGTATHFGVNGTILLAVGDYLSANILLGTISFDGNDNWHVTYIG
jgi:hypothetical protein